MKENLVLKQLLYEKNNNIKGGLYQRTLIKFFDMRHDFVEVQNMTSCFAYIIDTINDDLTQDLIKTIRSILKSNTYYTKKGDVGYKWKPNHLLEHNSLPLRTTLPKNVEDEMKNLLDWYSKFNNKTINNILDFLMYFILIHPFQDGNGRVSRLIVFRECLRNNIIPFIIDDQIHNQYVAANIKWFRFNDHKPLLNLCQECQSNYVKLLESVGIKIK